MHRFQSHPIYAYPINFLLNLLISNTTEKRVSYESEKKKIANNFLLKTSLKYLQELNEN